MSKTAVLTLRLEGALQAWGSDAKWDARSTDLFPTKSGVIGLIGSALGLKRDDPRIAELCCGMTMGVRADRPGVRITDFQTVTGAPLRTAEGKKRAGSQTFISRREYLSDASFLVALEGPENLVHEIEAALQEPRWFCYLGRKNCVPSRPLLEPGPRSYTSVTDALQHHPLADRHEPLTESLYQCEADVPLELAGRLSRSDLLSDGSSRRFKMRQVYRGVISCTL